MKLSKKTKVNLLKVVLYFTISTSTIGLLYMFFILYNIIAFDGMFIELIQFIYFLFIAFIITIFSTLTVLYFNPSKK
jgi:hypothetical protein